MQERGGETENDLFHKLLLYTLHSFQFTWPPTTALVLTLSLFQPSFFL